MRSVNAQAFGASVTGIHSGGGTMKDIVAVAQGTGITYAIFNGSSEGELEDITKRRYGKIIVMTDADVDGNHIRTLLLTFLFRHLRELMQHGCVYIAQPPLYKVTQKGKVRYVQTHEQMMGELVELGMTGSSLVCEDGTRFESDHLRKLVSVMTGLVEPLEALERRGIDLRRVDGHQGAQPEGASDWCGVIRRARHEGQRGRGKRRHTRSRGLHH